MLYTAVVNLDKRIAHLTHNDENFYFHAGQDIVIKNASVTYNAGTITICGDRRKYEFYFNSHALTRQEFDETRLRKDRFTPVLAVHWTLSSKFPFISRTEGTLWKAGKGWISVEETAPVTVKIPQLTIVDHTVAK